MGEQSQRRLSTSLTILYPPKNCTTVFTDEVPFVISGNSNSMYCLAVLDENLNVIATLEDPVTTDGDGLASGVVPLGNPEISHGNGNGNGNGSQDGVLRVCPQPVVAESTEDNEGDCEGPLANCSHRFILLGEGGES